MARRPSIASSPSKKQPNRYASLIEKIFFDRFQPRAREVPFRRTDITDAARDLSVKLPDNLGDLIYSFRFQASLPNTILAAQPQGLDLRTTVQDGGQIEIDELYLGIDSGGQRHVIPVQAKTGKDQISIVQTSQDIGACAQKFQDLRCICMFELAFQDDQLRVLQERHYRLVSAEKAENG